MIIGSNLVFVENLPSTNSEASLLLKGKEVPEGTVVYTGFQTAGRGQAGNSWHSEKGKNLLVSIILYPRLLRPEEQFLLSMTISLGICDFLDRHTAGVKIKWPNDIYVQDDKIAGILIENSVMENEIESSVAGIGLNINQEKFPQEIRNPVSLKMLTGVDYETETCLRDLLSDIDRRYRFLLYGDRIKIRDEYKSRLYRFNELHVYKAGERSITGRITDVSCSGLLTIREPRGRSHRFSFNEVDFEPRRGSSR